MAPRDSQLGCLRLAGEAGDHMARVCDDETLSGRFAAVRVRHAGGNSGKARLRPEQWLLVVWPTPYLLAPSNSGAEVLLLSAVIRRVAAMHPKVFVGAARTPKPPLESKSSPRRFPFLLKDFREPQQFQCQASTQ
jgi:hypothetical protein